MRIEPLGDSALLIRVAEEFDPEKSSDALLRGVQALERAVIPGVIELVPAYTTIAVFFDPARAVFGTLTTEIDSAMQASSAPVPPRAGTESVVEVPVCYDGEFGLDLTEVARQAELQQDQVIDRHANASYRVACVGFTPGFPYLTGMPAELATPRRPSPRKEVPAGAVAIGGTQTGIYPRKSPGGWNIIGRTPLRLFDVQREPPSLFRAGDQVRFRRISEEEFEAFSR